MSRTIEWFMTPEQVAWLAGLFEGEGYSELKMVGKFGPYPSIHIQMTDLDVLEEVHKLVGGKLTGPYQSKKPKADGTLRKPQWKWSLQTKREVLEICKLLYPWLKSRRQERIIQLIECLEAKDNLDPGYVRTPEHRLKMSEIKRAQSI